MPLPKRTPNTKRVWRVPGARPEVMRRVAAALQQPELDDADLSAQPRTEADAHVSV
ncbi:hypothetical protein [Nocardia higoensis]|uniref:hypothetical protein n=1 Tax=Nocardia higoensis TaxID=228599 RepID=UPI0002F338BF|nr:hypothetical protein [Nocardia higoensis]